MPLRTLRLPLASSLLGAALLGATACRQAYKDTGTVDIETDVDGDGVAAADDCDDEDASVGAESAWYVDADTDGYGGDTVVFECEQPAGYVAIGGDCDDAVAEVHPDADDVCDAVDNDCDGLVDDGAAESTWYTDADGDGYGDDATAMSACTAPEGAVAYAGDCDDTDPRYNPAADESDCLDPNDYNCDGSVGYADDDADGLAACEECDDGDAAIFPGADEHCNGVDDNCDGVVDEDAAVDASTFYADLDGDGFGDPAAPVTACAPGDGQVADSADCDDADPGINPDATEVCDGLDNDCDSLVDDADDSLDTATTTAWYADGDGDGYGADEATLACAQPAGAAAVAGDCDDTDTRYNPGAVEDDCADPNDYNCDGSVGYADADADGWAACAECDDADGAVFPGADETCNGVDDNCDGSVDEATAVDAPTWYQDLDGDGFGDLSAPSVSCDPGAGWVTDASDCDDARADIHPDAVEVCDGLDNDCDSLVDDGDDSLDGSTATAYYADGDGDGYGDGPALLACIQPAGTAPAAGDCDDSDAGNHPAATETCDGEDNDCDGIIDEADASDALTWYADADGDGFGDLDAPAVGCSAPSGFVADSADCDDTDAGVSPAQTEVCNGVDDNCDGRVDEATAADAPTWHDDADGDGFGDASTDTVACPTADGSGPTGTVADATDCDDADSAVNPAAAEACDGVDNDCDLSIDEGTTLTWYDDADADGFGDPSVMSSACSAPAGTVADGTDCDDGDGSVNPDATEVCDGLDNDCDGMEDIGAADAPTWYDDADADGFGDPTASVQACADSSGAGPSGSVADDADCDDTDPAVNPDAVETCDTVDNDCDGSTDGSDSWWSADWPDRVLVDLTASSYDVGSPPVLLDVDFRAALDSLGDASAFDGDTLRVVVQDCSSGGSGTMLELPSQFLDDYVGLLDKVSAADPVDEYGTVAFLLDSDGDPATLDAVAAGSAVTVGLYFGGSHPAPSYATDLAVTSASVENGLTAATFDDTRGGMLSGLTYSGSPSLESQADSCCGNSFYGGSWGIDPQDGAGTLTGLFDGPVVAAIEATGERSDAQSGYAYSTTYLMFAGRPEVWSKVHAETTQDSLLSHPVDITSGIRPWEVRHDNISGGGTFTTDASWADVSNGTWGMAFGWVAAPTYVIGLSNYDPYLIATGNDYTAAGLGSPATIPADTAFFDNIVQVHLPHAGAFTADVEDTLLGLTEGVTTSEHPAEER